MNEIGEQLRAAREKKDLSIEQVSDDTNIAKRYLTALEEENFSVFPGDPYVIGFLRNYAEYLGLEAKALLAAYRGMRIQEQPVPISQLLPPKKTSPLPFVAGGIVLVVLAGFLILRPDRNDAAGRTQAAEKRESVQYSLESDTLEKRFYVGDSILVPFNNERYRLSVQKIEDRVSIETPVGTKVFLLSEEGTIDLDRDNNPELTAYIGDFVKGDPAKGVVIKFRTAGALDVQLAAAAAQGSAGTAGTSQMPQPAVVEPASSEANPSGNPAAAITPVVGTTAPVAETKLAGKGVPVFTDKPSPYPFVVNVTFRNYAMFRYELDRKERKELYYRKGDQITANALNQAKIWASNAGACKITIQASGGQSADIDLGSPGVVSVKLLKWTQNESGRWNLSVFDVD